MMEEEKSSGALLLDWISQLREGIIALDATVTQFKTLDSYLREFQAIISTFAEKTGQGSWAASVALAKEFIAGLGLDPSHFQLHDGSGLSPQNRVPAADLVRFLRAMERDPHGERWRNTLAISGERDGTLRHRLNDPLVRGQILAKTGSLDRVSTLAGYARGRSGRIYAFAILLNGRGVTDGGGQAFQDRLLRALITNG